MLIVVIVVVVVVVVWSDLGRRERERERERERAAQSAVSYVQARVFTHRIGVSRFCSADCTAFWRAY